MDTSSDEMSGKANLSEISKENEYDKKDMDVKGNTAIFEGEDDEKECRVCRGEAEEGRDLFCPCICSGSIMYVHQDCLERWLKQSQKETCELCKYKIKFKSIYGDDIPDKLPLHLLLYGISKKWLPFIGRICLIIIMWLLVLPCATSCIYRFWIHRLTLTKFVPSIVERYSHVSNVWLDCISGLIITAFILFSFLSLMSFADFLRLQWDPAGGMPLDGEAENNVENHRNQNQEAAGDGRQEVLGGGGVHNQEQENIEEDNRVEQQEGNEIDDTDFETRQQRVGEEVEDVFQNENDNENSNEGIYERRELEHDIDRMRTFIGEYRRVHEDRMRLEGDRNLLRDIHQLERETNVHRWRRRNLEGHMDFNSDNEVDAVVINQSSNSSETHDGEQHEKEHTTLLHDESEDRNPLEQETPNIPNNLNQEGLHQPPIEVNVNENQINDENINVDANIDQNIDEGGPPEEIEAELQLALDEVVGMRGPIRNILRNIIWLITFNFLSLGLFGFLPYLVGDNLCINFFNLSWIGFPIIKDINSMSERQDQTLQLKHLSLISLGYLNLSSLVFTSRTLMRYMCTRQPRALEEANIFYKLLSILEMWSQIVKVGVLLFLKMLFIPLLFGVTIDTATQMLFGVSHESRVDFFSNNLVAALLLHWVIGITFMLVVTVCILQIREVLHPNILARIIRPQESHPDLLTSLLKESGFTHAKRMVMSLAIYFVLLVIFILVPSILLKKVFLSPNKLPLQFNFWYFSPQLQIPIELIVCHLLVLTVLERCRNGVSLIQTLFLYYFCPKLGLATYLLPLTSYNNQITINLPFSLSTEIECPLELEDHLVTTNTTHETNREQEQGNGTRKVQIVLPTASLAFLSKIFTEDSHVSDLLNKFNNRHNNNNNNNNRQNHLNERWDSVANLRRWAWAEEKPDETEVNLLPQVIPKFLLLRITLLCILAWMISLMMVLGSFCCPLYLGRMLYKLLHVSIKYQHDPFAYMVGYLACLCAMQFLPSLLRMTRNLKSIKNTWDVIKLRMTSFVESPPSFDLLRLQIVTFISVFGVLPFFGGSLFSIIVLVSFEEWEDKGLRVLNPVHDWLVGLVVLTFIIALLVVDFRFIWAQFWGAQNPRRQRRNGNQAGEHNNNANNGEENDWLNGINDNRIIVFAEINRENARGRIRTTFNEMRYILSRNIMQIWVAVKTNNWERINRSLLFDGFIFPLLRFYQRTIFFSVLTVVIGFQVTRDVFLDVIKLYLFGLTPNSITSNVCSNLENDSAVGWNIFLSCLNSSYFQKSFSFYLIVFRIGAAVAIALNIIELIWAPFTTWLEKMHEEIKEENYTVGRVLQNHPQKEHLVVKVSTVQKNE